MKKKGRKNGLPGGQVYDLFNRLSRCLAHACLNSQAVPIHDVFWYFDPRYSKLNKLHHLVLVVAVRGDREGLADRFYQHLESILFEQYGLDFDINSTVALDTRIFGSPYALDNVSVKGIWRTFIVWRSEDGDE